MCTQFAAAVQGLEGGSSFDDEQLCKPIKRFIADYVRKQVSAQLQIKLYFYTIRPFYPWSVKFMGKSTWAVNQYQVLIFHLASVSLVLCYLDYKLGIKYCFIMN